VKDEPAWERQGRLLDEEGEPPDIFTIGHSTHPFEELTALLAEFGVNLLADVRSVPRSRHNPQFNQDELARRLPEVFGIEYRHLPELGGLRRKISADSPAIDRNSGWQSPGFRNYADYMATDEFARGLAGLIELARGRRVAVMCAEALWWRCHRALISDALSVAGLAVAHIMGPGKLSPHRLTPFLRVEEGRLSYPAPEDVPGRP